MKLLFKRIFYVFSAIAIIIISLSSGSAPATGNCKLYYYRTDGIYTGYIAHIWNDDGWSPTSWGTGASFTNSGVTDGNPVINYTTGSETIDGKIMAYIEFPFPTVGNGIKFIIHKGDSKDPDGDRLWPSPSSFSSVISLSGDSNVYYESEPDKITKIKYITSAKIVSSSRINIELSSSYDSSDDLKLYSNGIEDTNISILSTVEENVINIDKSSNFDLSKSFSISINNQNAVLISIDPLFIDEPASNLTPSDLNEKLGCEYTGGTAIFKLWSPNATEVNVCFYNNWYDDNSADITIRNPMVKGVNGVWSATLNSVTEGQLYQYEVKYGESIKRVLDPYAYSMGAFKNGNIKDTVGKAAVINPSAHNPAGWIDGTYANLGSNWTREKAIIYEIHVRDFTIGLTSTEINGKIPGTYKAFIEKIQYLKDLGVTHIQLLPVLNYYYGNEVSNDIVESHYSYHNNNYNWGYDPHNYFTPEGMYSENPEDPILRISELKELIKAIHDNGMAVTLDVVYNHTANMGVFQDIASGYWYRAKDGIFTNKSGCGNDVETSNKMVRKLIVDSLKYWVDEYNVDGFRFDLMGIMDNQTILDGYNACKTINPNVLFIGEGWRPMYEGPSTDYAGNKLLGADQYWMTQTDCVSVFSDSYRNILKAGGFSEGDKGFLTGTKPSISSLLNNIKGQATNFTADDPGDCVQYIAAHDGFTWHDTVSFALHLDPVNDKKQIFKRLKLGNLVCLTSQGVSFIHGGQEMGRTKEFIGNPASDGWTMANHDVKYDSIKNRYYVRNSYDSTDAINKINWELLTTDSDRNELMEYTKGLIKLRKSTDAFSMPTKALVDTNISLIK